MTSLSKKYEWDDVLGLLVLRAVDRDFVLAWVVVVLVSWTSFDGVIAWTQQTQNLSEGVF